MKTVNISVINDLITDQRLHRMADSLAEEGYQVRVVGRYLGNPWPLNFRYNRVRRFRMIFRKGPLFYAFFNIRLLFYLLFVARPDLLIAIDLDTLWPNFLAAKIRSIPLIYDCHELFTEVPELIHRPGPRGVWTAIEKRLLPRLKFAMTVSDSIADYYFEKYHVAFVTLRNVSRYSTREKSQVSVESENARMRIIYQGALNLGRGIELMIRSMVYLEGVELLIAGTGDIENDLQELSTSLGLSDKVIFQGRIPVPELHRLTSSCKIGLSLEEDLGLSYRMSLPNKLFDYIQARILVICSDLPEMSGLVKKYKVGEVISKRHPKDLARQISTLLKRADKFEADLDKAASELCWEKEKMKLIEIVKQALND